METENNEAEEYLITDKIILEYGKNNYENSFLIFGISNESIVEYIVNEISGNLKQIISKNVLCCFVVNRERVSYIIPMEVVKKYSGIIPNDIISEYNPELNFETILIKAGHGSYDNFIHLYSHKF